VELEGQQAVAVPPQLVLGRFRGGQWDGARWELQYLIPMRLDHPEAGCACINNAITGVGASDGTSGAAAGGGGGGGGGGLIGGLLLRERGAHGAFKFGER